MITYWPINDKKNHKNMRRLTGLALSICMIVALTNCKEANGPTLSNSNGDGGTPDQVTNVAVENLPGGATISYSLPESESLEYVKAEYSTKNNGEQEVRASRFKNTLTVEGFAEAAAKEVQLISYSVDGNASEPVNVTVNPLIPPFETVFNSISLENDFGGIIAQYSENVTNAELTIAVVNDSLGEVLEVQNEYISQQEGTFSVRGLEPNTYNLGYYVRDKYLNRSDTVFSEFTPLFEQELDKSNWSNAMLPTDMWQEPSREFFERIWDNEAGECVCDNWYSRQFDFDAPYWVTIDLGQQVKVSRINLYGHEDGLYSDAYMKEFELWGSADPNTDDGIAFDDTWTQLGSYDTSENAGDNPDTTVPYPDNVEEYVIPDGAAQPYIRYLRFRMISNYSGERRMHIAELDIFGSPQDL
jgi:hypothetical protein